MRGSLLTSSLIGGALLAGCASPLGTAAVSSQPLATQRSPHRSHWGHYAQSPIQHIVIVVQENRSVDNLFQFLRGANIQSWGLNSQNQTVPLEKESLTANYDLGHIHSSWLSEYDNGEMNGFDRDKCKGSCPQYAAYAYVPKQQVAEYYTLAESYTFADNMFETDEGPSFPAHQYLVSGTSTVSDGSPNKASNNPETLQSKLTGGCDSPYGSLVGVINARGGEPKSLKTFPCFERQSLMNEMDAVGVSWKYYQATPGAGIWNAVDAIYSIWSNQPEMAANVISPYTQVLTDIANGQLADVVWVTPTLAASDHPKYNNGSGPSWVASVVNAIGDSPYWNNTAIFVLWDDWGGLYDHVTPTIYNSFELGFRVPLIVVSPYAKQGYISHVQHEFGSILKFTEETFGLPSLGTTDVRADDLADCFDFSKAPRAFKRIHAKYSPSYFFRLPSIEPDD
ncbi:MAG: alkaline phosphatase family protein [Candidatus Cybelea sp.]